MRVTPLPEFQSEALLPDQDFAPVEALIRAEAGARGLDLHSGHGRSVWCAVERGEFGARKRGGDVLVFARAHRAEWLAAMQRAIAGHLARHLPEAARALRWPSAEDAGGFPGNFSIARVAETRRLGADFLRLRLAAPDLRRFGAEDSIHFRLVLPSDDPERPAWPRLGANGQTVWPGGGRAVHRPVYTVRAIDPAAGWLDLDIFAHPGGRAAAWASRARPDAPVGLLGPSGGGIPQARDLLLAGDETALPAMARILESRGAEARGRVFLLGGAADYPLPPAPGFAAIRLPRDPGALERALRRDPPPPGAYLWMAAGRSAIARLRGFVLDELRHDRALTHLSAYWTEEPA